MATGTQYRQWTRFVFSFNPSLGGLSIGWERVRDRGSWYALAQINRIGSTSIMPLQDQMPKAAYAAFDAIWSSLVYDIVISLNVSTGTATETDSALNLTCVKIRVVGVALETDTSLKLTVVEPRSIGIATETDSALNLTRVKVRSIGLANETDTAIRLLSPYRVPMGTALETDTSLQLARKKIKSAGVSLETDSSLSLTKVKKRTAGVSLETDSSLQLARMKLRMAGVSLETDSSLNLARKKIRTITFGSETDTAINPAVNNVGASPPAFYFPLRFNMGATFTQLPIGYAVETDVALAVVRTKFYSVKIATETDVALNLGTGEPGFYLPFRFYTGVPGGAKLVNTGRAESINTALAGQLLRLPLKFMTRWAQETPVAYKITYRRIRATGVATSVNTSPGPRVAHVRSYGIAIETDTAIGPPFGIVGQVGVATEIDTALRLNYLRARPYGIAEEVDNALSLVAPASIDVGVAVEIDSALLLETNFARGIGRADELDEALPRQVLHTLATKMAESTNTAERLPRIRVTDTHYAQSFNTAFGPTPRKIRLCGTAIEVDSARGRLVRSYAAREYDNALFFEIKQNGVVIFPVVSTNVERRMWTGFIT